ncbi:MAG: class I SAM-dependent methyltransferase [Alphaproteobacteria bacterium]|jgi:cyclopropane fatty-acyl-phospholipid synthase-like methyltransferase|nr:class I SAM-dependent methyltransferase [Alphaproteobacteria bacterium]MBM3624325.1 class I SAM-dependent methyltransferase [Alphaproteobacteria bacterium]MBM3640459.1 class I SAM-dependent methyltransferase [Alphaproteobacteria bacterium]
MDAQVTNAYSGEIFDLWDTYKKVVVKDFMFHAALSEEVERALRARFQGGDFSLLDLGCGDAYVFAPILRRIPPASYKGVDLSDTALGLAAENLQSLPCPVQLAHSDILSALSGGATYDVIHSSFVLHHLATEDKAEFFRRASRALAPGGFLLLVDTMRQEDETRGDYLKHYFDWIEKDWAGLSRAEKDAIFEHISTSDYPEPLSLLEQQARAAGLKRLPGDVPHRWHHLMRFERA